MITRISKQLLWGAALTLSLGGFSEIVQAAGEAEFGAAINIAGRQRMLTQKMAKEALLVKLGINADENKQAMAGTIDLFDNSLKKLVKGDPGSTLPAPPNDDISGQLAKVEALWGSYRGKVEGADAKALTEDSIKILKEMNSAVKKYERASVKAGIKGKGKVINLAGRQRMLSQKMAKEVMLIALGVNREKNLNYLKSTKTLFETSLDALMNGNKKMRIKKSSNSEINAQLALVNQHWQEYAPLIDKVINGTGKPDNATLEQISVVCLKVLKEMHKAVGMYEKAS